MRLQIRSFLSNIDRAAVFFIVTAALMGGVFIAHTPIFWGNDEKDHFSRAYNIANGDVFAQNIDQERDIIAGYNGYIPETVVSCVAGVYEKLETDSVTRTGEHRAAKGEVYDRCQRAPLDGDTHVYQFPVAAAYSPLNYAPAVAGLSLSRYFEMPLGDSLRAMRIASLVFYIACGLLSIMVLRRSMMKWAIVAIGLVPTAVFQASIVTADTVTNAICLLFIALILQALAKGKKALSKELTVMLLLIVSLVPLLKPTYALFIALLFVVPVSRLAWPRVMVWLRFLVVAAALVVMFMWLGPTASLSNAVKFTNTPDKAAHIHPDKQIDGILGDPIGFMGTVGRSVLLSDDRYINGAIGAFGMLEVRAPTLAIAAMAASLCLATLLVAHNSELSRRTNMVVIVVIFLTVMAIFASLYATFTPLRYPAVLGVQGRYFVPVIGLIVWAATPIALRFKVPRSRHGYVAGMLTLLITATSLLTIVNYLLVI